jgi:phenylacetate-CoA ligase
MSFAESATFKALQIAPAYASFRSKYKFLQASQWWSKEQLEEYQLSQLNKLLEHAYDNVPYYTKVFDEHGLTPRDVWDYEDLERLPLLTKETIRSKFSELKATNYPSQKFEYVTTGGSTGVPLGFYYEKGVSRAKEWAFIRTLWGRVGYRFSHKCVVLKGARIKSAETGKYWETALARRWLVLSSYHITEDNAPRYIDTIARFKPRFIQAYPSTITLLANFMKKNGKKPFPTVHAIFCGSENLYPWQRELLESAFNSRVFSWYGHSEMGALAGECELSTRYHIFPEYGYLELVDKHGNVITQDGVVGEIVTTGFNNMLFPLIRYKTGDFASFSKGTCECNRQYKLLDSVEGRLQEYIVANNGRLIPVTTIFNIHSGVFDNVQQFQFYQEKEGELVVRIIKRQKYTESDSNRIQKALLERLGSDMRLGFDFVDNIPRSEIGKFKFLVQKLPVEILSNAR